MTDDYTRLPRLYISDALSTGADITLDPGPAHYLRSVMRLQGGDPVRVFNGRDGEWLAQVEELSKKSGSLSAGEQIRPQPPAPFETHLIFCPLKKQPLDFLIEKSVELGVTHLYPALTQHTAVRKINAERLQAQIIEAAEQCERLDVPHLHDLRPLDRIIAAWNKDVPLYWCYERSDARNLALEDFEHLGFLIGPEGGFTDEEAKMLGKQDFITPVSLGQRLLRAETAALACLSQVHLKTKKPV